MKTTIFIGGSKNIKKLDSNVLFRLAELVQGNYRIVIGDCSGVDTLVQQYLSDCGYTNVMIYVSGENVRNNVGGWNVCHIPVADNVSGFQFYRQKDIVMAEEADCGLMIWNGKSKGTYHNIMDLKEKGKKVEVFKVE